MIILTTSYMYSSFKKQIISSFNVILVSSEIKYNLSIIESKGLLNIL